MLGSILLSVLLAACSRDDGLIPIDGFNSDAGTGDISGRVCDPSGRTWLADALVYTNLQTPDGRIYETREAFTDRDGFWTLADLPAAVEYKVYVQYGTTIDAFKVALPSGHDVQMEEPACFDPLQVNVAVVTGDYDDFQNVLSTMGFANYTLVDGVTGNEFEDFLTDPETLGFYDIVFVNGGTQEEDVIYDTDGSDTDGVVPRIQANLLDFVEGGGSLYASDWAYDFVEQVWPDCVDFVGDDAIPDAAQVGEYDYVHAAVSDAALAEFLGKNYVDIDFDLPVWPPIQSVDGAVSVHLSGQVDYRSGSSSGAIPNSPLLVSFTAGEGKVVFGAFRVAKNATDDMMMALQYMMYTL